DPGHKREVVITPPPLLAERKKLAERAVVDRIGIRRVTVLDCGQKALTEAAVVGEEVVRSEGLALAESIDDMHRSRSTPLNARALLGVEAELQHVRWLRTPGKLRVHRLVGAIRLPLEKVREATPRAVNEGGLVDDRRTVADRLRGLFGRGRPANL